MAGDNSENGYAAKIIETGKVGSIAACGGEGRREHGYDCRFPENSLIARWGDDVELVAEIVMEASWV